MNINLNDDLTAVDSILLNSKVVTATVTGDAVDFGNGQLGSIEIIARASNDAPVVVAASQSVVVQLLNSSDAVIATLATLAPATYPAGSVISKFILPTNTSMPVKAKISTASAGGSGKIDVFANVLP